MRTRTLAAMALLGAILPIGCEGVPDVVTPDAPQVVTGEWKGSNHVGRFDMILAEEPGGRISGGGFVESGFRVTAFEVTGANAFPDVSLVFRFGEEGLIHPLIRAELVSYQAEFDVSAGSLALVGRLNGGNLQRVLLRVERESP